MLHRILSSVRTCTWASYMQPNPAPTILRRHLSTQRHKIRMLILSDTHGDDLKDVSLPRADVVLHCGDLTNDSRPAELERTLAMLRVIDAPLKLAIPGNHDFGLESGYWRRTRARSHPAQQQQQQQQRDQAQDDVDDADTKASWDLLRRAARTDSIFLLPQGTHTFVLPPPPNTASGSTRLRLFASPMTPRLGNWGFQYDRSNPPKWVIPPMMTTPNGDGAADVDVVMTHGPPRGIRDGTRMGKEGVPMPGAGCASLLAALERARPRVHCFGHIHGAWGAEVVAWKREIITSMGGGSGAGAAAAFRGPSAPTFSNLVDAARSRVVADMQPTSKTITTGDGGEGGGRERNSLGAAPPPMRTTLRHHSPPREEGCCCAPDISPDGEHAVEAGAQTLFVNAAVELRSRPPRSPWLIDIDLPMAEDKDAAAASETMYRLLL